MLFRFQRMHASMRYMEHLRRSGYRDSLTGQRSRLLQAATSIPSTLAPRGPAAAHIAGLFWLTVIACTAVFLLVLVMLLIPIIRAWRTQGDEPPLPIPIDADLRSPRPVREGRWIGGLGAAMPVTVLTVIFLATLVTLRASNPPESASRLTIEVTGHQWWWEIRYPGRGVVTANELHIPVGRPARIELRGVDVIHSFWIPQLNGKTDLVPGQSNATWIQADSAGHYLGECAEYCGPQHAHMDFEVVAEDSAAFDRWIATQRAPVTAVSGDGPRLFLDHGCASCHTIRGTSAAGQVGPDLTHVASRLTLAGGVLPNGEGDIGGWIANPGRVKPGTLMPTIPMPGADLRVLAAWLSSLR